MRDFHSDGMPCDRGAQVVPGFCKCTSWDHESCVHEPSWRKMRGKLLTMCDIANEWIGGFGEGINPKIGYKRVKTSLLSTYEIKE